MALGAFIAGRYSSTYGGSTLGITQTGYDLIFAPQYERIDESDAWGLTLIDLVYRGVRSQLVCRALEAAAAGMQGAIWPWNASFGTLGTIARMSVVSSLTSAIVLTSTAGTPAANSPASLSISRAQITEDSLALTYNSTLRRVPLAFHVIISDSGVLWVTS